MIVSTDFHANDRPTRVLIKLMSLNRFFPFYLLPDEDEIPSVILGAMSRIAIDHDLNRGKRSRI